MYFQIYRPRRTCSEKCLKDPVRDESSTGDMVNGSKHGFNINESAFIILSNHWEVMFSRFVNTLTADDKYFLISRDS